MKLINLRNLIREYIDEMAYGGLVGSVDLKDNDDIRNIVKKDQPDDYDDERNTLGGKHSEIEKFHKSSVFLKKANAAFKNFPFDVWILSISVPRFAQIFDMQKRYRAFDIEEIIERLNRYNIKVPVEQLRSITNSGGCIIISVVGSINKGFLPTPWMMIHALFDSGDLETGMGLITSGLFTFIYSKLGLHYDTLFNHMTMKSVSRPDYNDNVSPDDLCAELLTQEITTASGVQFKESNDPEIAQKLEILKKEIKGLKIKEKIFKMFAGKIVVVETANI